MGLPVATLKKGEGRMLKAGGLWVFDNEIAAVTEDAVNGELIAVQDFDGYPMGTGFYNNNSKITIRMMSRNKDAVIDEAFLRARVEAAWNYRKRTVDISSCRVIFGEADFLPGLVVDKFSDVLVVQSLAMGIDRMKETIRACSSKLCWRTASISAACMNAVMRRCAGRRACSLGRASSANPLIPRCRLWKTA